MNEDSNILAFELLEKNKIYASLSDEEKQIVLKVFGTKEEYSRMLSLSGIASEEDEEILAPSMMTESVLMKEFEAAYSNRTQAKTERKATWFPSFLTNRITKIALPAIVLIAGIFWFVNNQDINESSVSYESEEALEQKKLADRDTAIKKEKELESSLSKSNNSEGTFGDTFVFDEFKLEEDRVIKKSPKTEVLVAEDAIDTKDERIEDKVNEVTVMNFDFADTMPAEGDGSLSTSEIIDFKNIELVSEEESDKEISIDHNKDHYYSDDQAGNMATPSVSLEQISANGKENAGKKYKDNSTETNTSSSAQADEDLFDLLFTTY